MHEGKTGSDTDASSIFVSYVVLCESKVIFNLEDADSSRDYRQHEKTGKFLADVGEYLGESTK